MIVLKAKTEVMKLREKIKKAGRTPDLPTDRRRAWDEHAVAEAYGVAVGTLRNWRSQGRGPKYHKVGSRVLYRPGDCDSFFFSSPRLTADARE